MLFICLYMADQQIIAEIKNNPEYNTFHCLPSQPQPAHRIRFTGLLTDYPNNLATYLLTH
jgi:hypothetical protein